jgi:uncharacterized protein YxeA
MTSQWGLVNTDLPWSSGENKMAVRITCIRKAGGDHENPYVAITSLKWKNEETGATGESTRVAMYAYVVDEKGVAYVQSGASKAYLTGAISAKGTKYVKTEANNTEKDNLLKLPECS